MLLSLTPPAPLPTILFTLTFPSLLPESLPIPTAWDSHLHIVTNLRIAAPPDLHALDKSAAWVSLIDTVNFDLGTLTLTCTFIDRSKEEWTLSSSCVDLLEKVISDVNRSAKEAESEAEVRTQMRSPSKSNSASESVSSLQGQGPSPSPSSTSSSLGSSGNGNTNTGDSSVVTVKTPKPKKRRSILAALVASLVPLPSSRNATPASTRSSSPSSQLATSPSGGSLRGPAAFSAFSPSQSQHEIMFEPELITPPPGVPLSRYLRRRARSTLVDAFRRFVLPELGSRYRSETAKVNFHVNLPLGGPFYALWATRSMMRSVEVEMGRVLAGFNRRSDSTSSTSSSPLETPISPGEFLDDCTTTDESSVHSIVDQAGSGSGVVNAKSSSPLPLPIPLKIRRKANPALSAEAYDAYANLRETYSRLRSLSSQLEAHIQAENYIECVGSSSSSSIGEDVNIDGTLEDIFNTDSASSRSSSRTGSQSHEQLTSAEIKSRRRAWSTKMYLVSGWETYHGSSSRRGGLYGHKRSYSEPAPRLQGGSPMSLVGLSMPARPSPLSQMWTHEPDQDSLEYGDAEHEGVYIGAEGRIKSKWNRSIEGVMSIGIGRKQRDGSRDRDAPRPGHRRERCMSMIIPSRKSKLRPKVPSPHSVYVYEDDYTGVESGSGLHVRVDVAVNVVDEDAGEEMGLDNLDDGAGNFEDDFDLDVDDCEMDSHATSTDNSTLHVGMEKLSIGNDRKRSKSDRGTTNTSRGKNSSQSIDGTRVAASCSFADPASNDSIDDHFDVHSYTSRYSFSQTKAHSSRALRHFRYDYGSDFLPAAELQDDSFGHDDAKLYESGTGSDVDYEYDYSRSYQANMKDGDGGPVGSGLYKKPSLEEFILPHPRSHTDCGLNIAHASIVDNLPV